MTLRALLIAGSMLAALPARAQTAIVPDAASSPYTAGTVATTQGPVTTISGGTQAGGNLFHSFETFMLANGDTARWTSEAPDSVVNVINRVTGGTVSTIAGTIDTTSLPRASFFFINPAGVVFGDGASVNVAGAAHFTTAAGLTFADGTTFSTLTPQGSQFTIAEPASFGFLGNQGDIAIAPGQLAIGATDGLDLVGANVAIDGADIAGTALLVRATGAATLDLGIPALVPMGLGGSATIGASTITLATPGALAGMVLSADTIAIDATSVRAATLDGGIPAAIVGVGREIAVTGSKLVVTSGGSTDAGKIALGGSDSLLISASTLDSSTQAGSTGAAGGILLNGGALTIDSGSNISTTTFGAGLGGSISIGVRSLAIDGGSQLTARSDCTSVCTGAGAGGTISIFAGDVAITGSSFLSASTFTDAQGGALSIQADTVSLQSSSLFANSGRSGDAGAILLDVGDATLVNAQVQSQAQGSGNAGLITILSRGTVSLDSTRIESNAQIGSSGAGGTVSISAVNLFASNGSKIRSDTDGAGRAGDVFVTLTDRLAMDGLSSISSDSCVGSGCLDAGQAGLVSIDAQTIDLAGASEIRSRTNGSNDAGDVIVSGRDITLSDGSNFSSDTDGLGGGGIVDVTATGRITLAGQSYISSDSCSRNNCVIAGDAGFVTVEGGTVALTGSSFISSDSCTGDSCIIAGQAGVVSVTGNTSISVTDDSDISSNTNGPGGGGNVFVSTRDLMLDTSGSINSKTNGAGFGGFVTINATGSVALAGGSSISADSCADLCGDAGRAGSISVSAPKISLTGNSSISSDSYSSGAAGDVTVSGGTLSLGDFSFVSSDAVASGNAGIVSIGVDKLALTTSSTISSEVYDSGAGGNVFITAKDVSIDSATIATRAREASSGDAGNILLATGSLSLANGAAITTATMGFGSAGLIDIRATSVAIDSATVSSSTGPTGGDGGQISIDAQDITVRNGGLIDDTLLSSGRARDVFIKSNSLTLDNGRINNNLGPLASAVVSNTVIRTGALVIRNGGSITGVSASLLAIGSIDVTASTIAMSGIDTVISTSNTFAPAIAASTDGQARPLAATQARAGQGGAIALSANAMTFADGATISSNSVAGPAGSIALNLTDPLGLLRLEGITSRGIITTSSGPGQGGQIAITGGLALISNGGEIRSLGQLGGANVRIGTRYYIESADRTNLLLVDGVVRVDSNVTDVSAGLVKAEIAFVDASNVLSAQCAASRASGVTSQISAKSYGPYVPPNMLAPAPVRSALAQVGLGQC